MKRLTCIMSLLAVLSLPAQAARDDETPTIKQVMQKLHKGANTPLARLKKALAAGSPDWAAILKGTKQFKTLGAALPKNEPPRGDKEGYLKLANAYYQNAKATDEAANNKDKIKAASAFAKLSNSCAACHKAHRPN